MSKKMLIDATHPEETRVVVVDGTRVEEFDFESASKRQLAGNIYLAKVTRVEPSLQAAFVEYGGNRHGFLAFNEIHPDYYQIPKADREALLREEREDAEAQAAAEEAEDAGEGAPSRRRPKASTDPEASEDGGDKPKKRSRSRSRSRRRKSDDEGGTDAAAADAADGGDGGEPDGDATPAKEAIADDAEAAPDVASGAPAEVSEAAGERGAEPAADDGDAEGGEERPDRTMAEDAGLGDETLSEGEAAGMETVEPAGDVEEGAARDDGAADDGTGDTDETGGTDPAEEAARARPAPKPRMRKYKIQEVVKVRQIMLVQVVKEERGNKGAALTTYLSLAGRYCVLMPNTARGGGISRKITNAADRKKLKEIATGIDVPQGAGLIVRTAGAKRTKTEIKRDYEYLQRQWEQIRALTLQSIAPAAIYEEGNLIHRSIRDLYSKEIGEICVEGETGFRQARDYMSLILPDEVGAVKHYGDTLPLFARHGVDATLDAMFDPTVHLRSGGYIVIDITEALVAVDVNSGRATKEGSIEETALKTNLEAAEEVARQAKLRDLAGLIVIDFIDMDERRNNAAVEKRLKDALKNDRARIQLGRISSFGLLEMSRQRLRPGMLEASTQPCPQCQGTGLIRSDGSLSLMVLRGIEEEGVRRRSREVAVRVPVSVANFLMNDKREHLAAVEARYEMAVRVIADPTLVAPDWSMEKFKTATRQVPKGAAPVAALNADWAAPEAAEATSGDDDAAESAEAEGPGEAVEAFAPEPSEDEERPKKRRRRRSRRKGRGGDEGDGEAGDDAGPDMGSDEDADTREEAPAQEPSAGETPKRSRSRSRRRKSDDAPSGEASVDAVTAAEAEAPAEAEASPEAVVAAEPEGAPTPKRRRRSRSKAAEAPSEDGPAPAEGPSEVVEAAAAAAGQAMEAAPAPEPVPDPAPQPEPVDEPEPAPEAEAAAAKPKRRGWWSLGR